MPPKGKGKKGGKQKKVNPFPEVDRTLFELLIADLHRKIARQKYLGYDYESRNAQLEAEITRVKEETADTIHYLKRRLAQEEEKYGEEKLRLKGLHESLDAQAELEEEGKKQMDDEFNTMTRELTVEMEALQDIVNKVEDFRDNRDNYEKEYQDLVQKLKDQEEWYHRVQAETKQKTSADNALSAKEAIECSWEMSMRYRRRRRAEMKDWEWRRMNEELSATIEEKEQRHELVRTRAEMVEIDDEIESNKARIRTLRNQNKELLWQVCLKDKRLPELRKRCAVLEAKLEEKMSVGVLFVMERDETERLQKLKETEKQKMRPLVEEQEDMHFKLDMLKDDVAYNEAVCDKLKAIIDEACNLLKDSLKKKGAEDPQVRKREEEEIFRRLFFILSSQREVKSYDRDAEAIELAAPYRDGDLGFIRSEAVIQDNKSDKKRKVKVPEDTEKVEEVELQTTDYQ